MFSTHVHAFAAKAETAMPAAAGRIARAVELVLGGCVEELGAGRWEVASQCQWPEKWYLVADRTCTCPDFQHRSVDDPAMLCKHLLATYLYRRAVQAIEQEETMTTTENTCGVALDADGLPCYTVNAICPGHSQENTMTEDPAVYTTPITTPAAPAPALPEAPASVNVRFQFHGREIQLTLRGNREEEVMERLAVILDQYAPASGN